MATLVSPGVSVTMQNDTFYPAAGPGTVPLVIFATAQDKLVPGSSSIVADGTKKSNAGKMYLMTSQRDVLQTFGVPIFQEANGTVVQGDELNEYGLHALFSAMGVTNRAYALRADIDMNVLRPRSVQPSGDPANLTNWIDLHNSKFGLYSNVTGVDKATDWKLAKVHLVNAAPQVDLGNVGDVAMNYVQDTTAGILFYVKLNTGWTTAVTPVCQPYNAPLVATTNLWMRTDAAGASFVGKKFSASTGKWSTYQIPVSNSLTDVEGSLKGSTIGSVAGLYTNVGGVKKLEFVRKDSATKFETSLPNFQNKSAADVYSIGSSFDAARLGHTVAVRYYDTTTQKIVTINHVLGDMTLPTAATTFADAVSIKTKGQVRGSVVVPGAGVAGPVVVNLTSANSTAFDVLVYDKALVTDGLTVNASKSLLATRVDSTWKPYGLSTDVSLSNTKLIVSPTGAVPSRTATKGTLWFDDNLYADILINRDGKWEGLSKTGGATYFFSQSMPEVRPAGGSFVTNDIWIDPTDGSVFDFYRYTDAGEWLKLDDSNQSDSAYGILFADARGNAGDANATSYFNSLPAAAMLALASSDYVDPTCPDPRMYPSGMILVNLMQTGGVVRSFDPAPFADFAFNSGDKFSVGDPLIAPELTLVGGHGRWVTESGLASNGAALFGRNAQRKIVVEALAAAIVGNDEVRAETVEYNLMTAPGYNDLIDELVSLNVDRKETTYIITDVPARLAPNATSINNWAKNVFNAPSNNEQGRITRYDFAAQYMGWGLGTNVDGKEVAIPGSTIALRTYLYSDSVSYVWFPPAGVERGIVTNAASIGYINSEGEYAPVIYNQGQRDVMYLNNINPIALRPNRGLVVFGDKSLSPSESAIDRVNVGRLVVYIRTEVAKIGERFLFKLNTPRVREEFAGALTAFLANILQLEGLEDFAVVCDSSNNTPIRTQRNELWADIAIVPTKSINYVYVPIRLKTQAS